jgi:trk system potassium uptake protein TrkA
MGKQVAIIGLGRFGTNLAITLHNAGFEVLAIDKSSELVDNISPLVRQAVKANSTNESALQKLGIGGFGVAVNTIGSSVQDSIMTTILLKKLNVGFVVAIADNELHGDILESVGADKVIYPERDTALKTWPIFTMRGVVDYITLGNGTGIVKAKAPFYFIGKTLEDLGIGPGTKIGAEVLMIQREKESILNPGQKEVITQNDVLVIVGNNSDIDRLLAKDEKSETKDDLQSLVNSTR